MARLASGARSSIDAMAATASSVGFAARAALGTAQVTSQTVSSAGRAAVDAAGTLGRATKDVAGAAGRLTMDAAAAVGRASFDASAIAITLAQWAAAQPFDKTPYAEDTLLMLKLDGFQGSPEAGGLWLKPGAAARIVRLPHGLHSGPSESLEAVVAATVTDSGMVRLAVCVPRTRFQWERELPAATPAIAVPGLSINAFGWANLGLLVSWSLAPGEPRGSGHALVVHLSIGASVYGLGKAGIPLYEIPIPLGRISGLFARTRVESSTTLVTSTQSSQNPPNRSSRDGPGLRDLSVGSEPPVVEALKGPHDSTAPEESPWASEPTREPVHFEQDDCVVGQMAPSTVGQTVTVCPAVTRADALMGAYTAVPRL